jgi:hypothetical protein
LAALKFAPRTNLCLKNVLVIALITLHQARFSLQTRQTLFFFFFVVVVSSICARMNAGCGTKDGSAFE